MPLFHLFILALIQGVTEFLPVSSSGHLILYPLLTGVEDQGLALDVAVHAGTLAAVMLYFRSDVATAVRGGFRVLGGDLKSPDARLALMLVIATIPAIILGAVLSLTGLTEALRSIAVIGWAMLGGGVLLWLADKMGGEGRTAESWSFRDTVIMGLAQAAALIPGMSRSGVTVTAARALGFERVNAARLSMLMSIPVIIAAAALIILELISAGDAQLGASAALAALLAFGSALAAIAVFMKMLERWSMMVFVLYRFALGAALLFIAYG